MIKTSAKKLANVQLQVLSIHLKFQERVMKGEELAKKREEAERKVE